MDKPPYRLEIRQMYHGEQIPYAVNTDGFGYARRIDWTERCYLEYIAALEAENARLRRLLAEAGVAN